MYDYGSLIEAQGSLLSQLGKELRYALRMILEVTVKGFDMVQCKSLSLVTTGIIGLNQIASTQPD